MIQEQNKDEETEIRISWQVADEEAKWNTLIELINSPLTFEEKVLINKVV